MKHIFRFTGFVCIESENENLNIDDIKDCLIEKVSLDLDDLEEDENLKIESISLEWDSLQKDDDDDYLMNLIHRTDDNANA